MHEALCKFWLCFEKLVISTAPTRHTDGCASVVVRLSPGSAGSQGVSKHGALLEEDRPLFLEPSELWIGKSCGLDRIEEVQSYMRVNNHSVQERGFRRALHMPCAYNSPRRSLDAEYIMQISASPLISNSAPLDRN